MESSFSNRRDFIKLSTFLGLSLGAKAILPSPIRKGLGSLVREAEAATTELGLKDFAPPGFQIGAYMMQYYEGQPDIDTYRSQIIREFNIIQPGSTLFLSSVRPTRHGDYVWGPADEMMDFAAEHNLLIKGTPLVWHALLPDWFSSLTKAEAVSEYLSFVHTVISRYANRICNDGRKLVNAWDVLNEPIYNEWDSTSLRNDDPLWSKFDTDEEKKRFMIDVFDHARAADPDIALYYADASGEIWGSPKSEAVYNLVRELKDMGAEIDAVGLECHFPVSFAADYNQIGENMKRLSDLGVRSRIAEMDVWFKECDGTLEDQAAVFGGVLAQALQNRDICNGFCTLDHSDKHNWIPWCDNLPDWYIPGFPCTCSGMPGPALFDQNLQKKPAYYAVEAGLKQFKAGA